MNFTYIGSRKAKILSDLKGTRSSTGKPIELKGTTQSVDEYDFTVSGRGNPQGTTTKRYFLESNKKNTTGMLPKDQVQMVGGNPFQEIKREDFEYLADETKAPKGFGDPIKDKKWILYVVLAVAGYFAYKKFKK
jgi:hypothetical protein